MRPYPATLVRWPTAVRNGGMPESSGSGGVNYISNGGGSAGNPQVGDWQNLRLILTLRPAGPMFVTLPHIGDLVLPNGASQSIQWEVCRILLSAQPRWQAASVDWMNCLETCLCSLGMDAPHTNCSGNCAITNMKPSRTVLPDRMATAITTAAAEQVISCLSVFC